MILGCDPAAKFGWAIINADKTYIKGGTQKFDHPSKAKLKKGTPKGQKWLDFQIWFNSLIEENKFDLVVYEEIIQFTSSLQLQSYGFFKYSILAKCAQHKIETISYTPSQWRKKAFGVGAMDKVGVAEALLKLYPDIVFETDDHSDALGIAYASTVLNLNVVE